MGYIYRITNITNKKCYIGQTKQNVNRRWSQHKYGSATVIARAIKKYGKQHFKYEIICICFDNDTVRKI